jgi:hypothetical protein
MGRSGTILWFLRRWASPAILAFGIGGLNGAGPDVPTALQAEGEERLPERVSLEPGLVVGVGPSKGWEHIVVRSVPRLASGEIESLPVSREIAGRIAGRFRTAILVDVAPSRRGYVLRRVGVGMTLRHDGRDVVVTTDSLDRLGIALGPVPRLVLAGAERELERAHLMARTRTFAIYTTPGVIRIDGRHLKIWLRYAVLVEPADGSLRTCVWWVTAEESSREPVREWVLMPRALVRDCALDVAAKRVLGRVPVSWSFAMLALPDGRPLPVPEALRDAAARDLPDPVEAAAFEHGLRRALDGVTPPVASSSTR